MTSDSDQSLLNQRQAIVKSKKVQRWRYGFLDNFWYNAPFYEGKVINTYSVFGSNDQIAPIGDPSTLTQFGYISFTLIQDQVEVVIRCKRNAIAGTFLLVGAFISMITRITNLCLSSYQGFSVDKSMIKKLYSWKGQKKKKATNEPDEIDQLLDANQRKIKNNIQNRSIFSYSYKKAYRDWFNDKLNCCCCWFNCLCCRRNRRKSKSERIFMQAQRNLYNEIDLLQIVKQIRISKFMSTFNLNHNQRELVKFMKQYTLITRMPRNNRVRSQSVWSEGPGTALEDQGIERRSPFEDLLEYNPDSNNIDSLLHNRILD